jgi:SAM-dependent methyltransferase
MKAFFLGLAGTVVRRSRLLKIAAHLMRPHNSIYHQDYFAETVEGPAKQSASVMAASIFKSFHPNTVIDVGCGTGALLAAFRDLGCDVLGLEYSDAALAYCRERNLPVRKFNVVKDHLEIMRHDLAVSFEVAEHLPSWSARRYVNLLCSISPLIVTSAATPGAGGTDHVNERPHSYWIDRFAKKEYNFDRICSQKLSSAWRAAGVAYWYCDNVMVFRADAYEA